jgi:hypothetical protein
VLAPAEHVERTTFYYDPRAKKNREMHTDMELLEASRRLAAKVGYDADRLAGESLVTSRFTCEILTAVPGSKLENGQMVTLQVIFRNVHGDDLVMMNENHQPFHIHEKRRENILFALIPPKKTKQQA